MLRTPYKGGRSANSSLALATGAAKVTSRRPTCAGGSQHSLDSLLTSQSKEDNLLDGSRSFVRASNSPSGMDSDPQAVLTAAAAPVVHHGSGGRDGRGRPPYVAGVHRTRLHLDTAVLSPSPPTSSKGGNAHRACSAASGLTDHPLAEQGLPTLTNDSPHSGGASGRIARMSKRLRPVSPGGIEISYSSTLLFAWAVLLSCISWHCGYTLQAVSMVILCTVALTSEHGETRLLWPLVFLSERCLDHAQHQSHSPIEFYCSSLLSYLTLVACKAERKGKSARDRNVVLETVLYAAVGLCFVFSILKDNIVCFSALAFVGTGYAFFLKLLPKLGDNEAVLVSTLVGFYIGDLCLNNNLSVDGGRETILSFNAPGYLTSYTHIASRGMMLGAIYLMFSTSVLANFCLVCGNKNSKSSVRRVSQRRISIAFYASFVVISTILFLAVSFQFRENVIVWLYGYLFSSKFRMWTIISWAIGIPVSVTCVDLFTRGVRQTVRRKLFHFIAVITFTPVVMVDPAFFAFAISTATSLCVTVEVGRHYGVYGTEFISVFASRHIDSRDDVRGTIRTHIYLIFGLGVSLILQYRHHPNQLEKPVSAIMELSMNIIPGIISLGIVDATAAIVGSSFLLPYRRALGRYLKNQLFTERANTSITHKTTTGTIGGLVGGVLFWCLILIIAEVPFVGPVFYSFILILVCSLTECFMDGIDNLQMPLVVLGAVNSLFALLLPADDLWVNPGICRPNPTTARSLASALSSPWKNLPPVPDKVKSLIS